MLGFVGWPFLVPTLAVSYLDPAASQGTRAAVSVVFLAFNQFAGVGIGEHPGYAFTGFWVLLVGLAMLDSEIFPRWLGGVRRVRTKKETASGRYHLSAGSDPAARRHRADGRGAIHREVHGLPIPPALFSEENHSPRSGKGKAHGESDKRTRP